MDWIEILERRIESIIKNSKVPEDPFHSKNTLEWVCRLTPKIDPALKIAALGHDIERAIEERKVRSHNFKTYDEFKRAHALNSASILKELMLQFNLDSSLVDEVYYLTAHHEEGGDKKADILKDADCISFFDVNLKFYYLRNSLDETKRRCLWGYSRMSQKAREIVSSFHYHDKLLQKIVDAAISDFKKSDKKCLKILKN
jgi:hypothetical protein